MGNVAVLWLLFFWRTCAFVVPPPLGGRCPHMTASVLEDVPTLSEVAPILAAEGRWSKSTKQLATVGPASSTFEMLEALFLAGADVFRLNFSHGKHEEKKSLVADIRKVEEKWGRPVGILADLQGPKLRVGVFEDDKKILLAKGQKFRFDLDQTPGDNRRVNLPHKEIIETLNIGDILLVDDGKIKLKVTATGDEFAETVVEVAGTISNRKGVNTPSVVLPISPLTEKDRADLAFSLTLDIDWVALSFVQRPEDIEELRDFIDAELEKNPEATIDNIPRIMAKLEKPAAVQDSQTLKKIVELCDGIMVARGDLGVEMKPEDVPVLQKQIIAECRRQGKPVVVATQMLESMIDSPTPTRAECSDIATALYDGADAVMLSAESAAGSYPVEAVSMQRRVISRVESDELYRLQQTTDLFKTKPQSTATDAVTLAARQIVETVNAKCLAIFTERGTTVLRAAKGRPPSPILALTPTPQTARALTLVWGVYGKIMQLDEDLEGRAVLNDKVLNDVVQAAKDFGYLHEPIDLTVVTAGLPLGTPGAANVIRVVPAVGPAEWPDALCFPETEECVEI